MIKTVSSLGSVNILKKEVESLQAKLNEMDNRATKYACEMNIQALKLGKTERQLTIAVEALEECIGGDDYYNRPVITEALAEIKNIGE